MKIESFKNYIEEFKNVERYYFDGLKEKTLESKFEYIKNHFVYDILNSWNNLESIANNVKIFNLKLTRKQEDRFFELSDVDAEYIYDTLNYDIEFFKDLGNFNIFYNGRNGGYLVIVPDFKLYNKNMNILDLFFGDNIYEYDTFKEYKKESIDNSYGYDNTDFNDKLEECYFVLKAFDKLCDVLRADLINILNTAEIEEETILEERTYKRIV